MKRLTTLVLAGLISLITINTGAIDTKPPACPQKMQSSHNKGGEIKLKVPFYKQTTNLDCGPTALRIALSFLGKDHGIEKLREAVGIAEGKGVSTIRLAIAASKLDHKVMFLSKSLFFDKSNLELDFYKKHGDVTNVEASKRLVEEAKDAGVLLEERSVGIGELLSYVSEDSLPIILLDWNVVRGKEGYQGHFVPVVGYDDESIYVHNQGMNNPQAYLPIRKELFEKARKARGTDEDLVIIFRKR